MSIHAVETDTFSMEYSRFGHGASAFAILPGLSVQSVLASEDAVAAAFKPFTNDFTVYLFDRRKDVPPTYPVREMARDTAEAMRTLGLGDVCVYGASQGGMIAMELAMEYPELVRKLVLASTTARVTDARFQAIEKWIRLARAGRTEELYMAFGAAIYPADVFSSLRASLSKAAETVTAGELERFAILAKAARGFDVMDSLGRIRCPVLVMGSRDDQVFGEQASPQIAGAIPGARLLMYDDYGHAAYDTAPDFIGRMLEFLRQA
jgi:pimeloyl-ACP methyl ester carboxylesterase